MGTHELEHAVKMLEQITANFAWDEPDKAAAAVASHITRFWSPDMRRMVAEAERNKQCELSEVAALAIRACA